MAYISESGRDALINYQYQASCLGWIDNDVMNPFWEKVVTFVPLSIAPNVITFTATIQWLISVIVFSTYCNDLQTCAESWCWYLLAVSLFIYQTLDAIDGKQARRTKNSSPLGELFDHGNDAFAFTSMTAIGLIAIRLSDGGWNFIFPLIVGYTTFFMVIFNQRHIGILQFPVFSVTEIQFLGIVIFVLTGTFGCDIWDILLPVIEIPIKYIACGLVPLCVYIIITKFWSVQKYYDNNQKKDTGQIYELLQLLLFIIGILSWNLVGVINNFPWTYVWISGLIFCCIIHRIIVVRVTAMDTTKYFHALNPLVLMIFGSFYEIYMKIDSANSIMNSEYMVYGILIYVMVFWYIYVSAIINEICETLNIKLFVMKKPTE